MAVDKNGLKKAIQAYKHKSHEGFSKDKIKSDLKNIFDEYHVDATAFSTMSLDQKVGLSISSYLDKLANVIHEKEQEKTQDKTQDKTNQENKEESNTSENNHRSKPLTFMISSAELKGWSDDELKPQLINKMLRVGFTHEEINGVSNGNFTHISSGGEQTNLNISGNVPLIDRMVELYKMLKRGLEDSKSLDDILSQNNSLQTENPEQAESDELTAEDLDDIMNYGIEEITTHSEMEEFRKSEEWEQIQAMQENALSRYDD